MTTLFETPMKDVLLIDDQREPGWIRDPENSPDRFSESRVEIARTAEEGIVLLRAGVWKTLLLDHDLGMGKNGMDVILFLDENRGYIPRKVFLVTANIIAGPKMLDYLKRWASEGLVDDWGWIR